MFGVGSTAPNYYAEQIQAPSRDATPVGALLRENAVLQTEVRRLEERVITQSQELNNAN